MIRSVVTTRDRVRIHYRRLGRGPGMVLLHGYPQTGHIWRKVMPALHQLPDDRDAKIAVPTLVLWGEGRTAQAGDMLGVWRARCAGPLEGFAVPECGHFIPEERPEVVIDAVLKFAGAT